ncbi:MAG: phosphodiester glycosidase family protein [Gemmatimonadetes bacterium]|nr:phosphodiester glycosidase family protein [Gemmatimonadota bacterium]
MRSTIRSVLLALVLAAGAVAPTLAQVAVGSLSGTVTYDSTVAVSGYVAYLDLSGGAFTPVVSPLSDSCRQAGNGQVSMLPTRDFQSQNGTLLAITANSGPAMSSYKTGTCGVPAGLVVSGGLLVNPGQTGGPVLYFNTPSAAAITGGTVPTSAQWAVAGSTNTNNDCPNLHQPGSLLVANGTPGVCPIPKSTIPAARGAVGVDATGTVLIVAVVEGAEGTSGLKTADLASLLIGLGAVNAVNFDGGGSTVFYWTPGATAPVQSAKLVQMLKSAAVPSKLPNPGSLTFKVTPLDPSQQYVYDASAPGGRPIYASLGFLFGH